MNNEPATDEATPAAEPAATASSTEPAEAPAATAWTKPASAEASTSSPIAWSPEAQRAEGRRGRADQRPARRWRELLENLAVSVRKAGGFPIVFYDTDRLDKRMFFDVPPKYDTQPDKATLGLMGLADAVINVADGTTENLFEGADPARI